MKNIFKFAMFIGVFIGTFPNLNGANIPLCKNKCGGTACETLQTAQNCLTNFCEGLENNTSAKDTVAACRAAAASKGFYDPKTNQFGSFLAGQGGGGQGGQGLGGGGQGGGADPAELARLQAKLQKAKQERAMFQQQLAAMQAELARLKAQAGGAGMPASDPEVVKAFDDFTQSYDASSNKDRVAKFKEALQKIEIYGDFAKGVELYTFILGKFANLDLNDPKNADESDILADFQEKIRESKDATVKASIAKIEREKAEIAYQQRHTEDKAMYDRIMADFDKEFGAPTNLRLQSNLVYPNHKDMKVLLLMLKLKPATLREGIQKKILATDLDKFNSKAMVDTLSKDQAKALRWLLEETSHNLPLFEKLLGGLLGTIETRLKSAQETGAELTFVDMEQLNKQFMGVYRTFLGYQAIKNEDSTDPEAARRAAEAAAAAAGGGKTSAGSNIPGNTAPPKAEKAVLGKFIVNNPPKDAGFRLGDSDDAFVKLSITKIIGELNRQRQGAGPNQAFELIPTGPAATDVIATYIRSNPAAKPIYAKVLETRTIPNDAQRLQFQLANIAPEIDALYTKNAVVSGASRGAGGGGVAGDLTNVFFDPTVSDKAPDMKTLGIQGKIAAAIRLLNADPKRADASKKIPLKGSDFNRLVNYIFVLKGSSIDKPEDVTADIDQAFTIR